MAEHKMEINMGTMEAKCSCGESFDAFDAIAHQREKENEENA